MAKIYSTGLRTLEEKNKAIAIPGSLFTKDGREIKITYWAPVVDIGSLLKVTIEGFIITKPLT